MNTNIVSMGAIASKQNLYQHTSSPAYMRLQLKCNLLVQYPESSDKYKLLIYASRDIHNHSIYNRIIEINNDETTDIDFCVVTLPKSPDYIYFWLFVDTIDEDKLQIETFLGCGKSNISNFCKTKHSIDLYNLNKTLQAKLRIKVDNPLNQIKNNAIEQSYDSLPALLIEKVASAYDQFIKDDDSFFTYVATPEGLYPIISYAIMSQQLQVSKSDGHLYLQHLLNISCHRLEIEQGSINKNSNCIGELLSEMLLWSIRARIYTSDTGSLY